MFQALQASTHSALDVVNLELDAKLEKGSKSVSIADFRSAKSAAKFAAR